MYSLESKLVWWRLSCFIVLKLILCHSRNMNVKTLNWAKIILLCYLWLLHTYVCCFIYGEDSNLYVLLQRCSLSILLIFFVYSIRLVLTHSLSDIGYPSSLSPFQALVANSVAVRWSAGIHFLSLFIYILMSLINHVALYKNMNPLVYLSFYLYSCMLV